MAPLYWPVTSDYDYGLNAARSFQSGLPQSGEGCLAYLEVLPWEKDENELQLESFRNLECIRKNDL